MRILLASLVAGLLVFQPAAAQDRQRMPITLDPQTGEVMSNVDAPLPFANQDAPTVLAADMPPSAQLPPPTISPIVPRNGPEPRAPTTPDNLVHTLAPGDVRIKDIADVEGVRENQLVGYGLVVGLQGTGDTLRNAAFSEQSLQSMLERLGVNVRDSALRTRNIAAVIATAELPAFAGAGSRIDVNVASLGDASSLQGGTLVITQLAGADGEVYAVAQGPIAVTGYSAAAMPSITSMMSCVCFQVSYWALPM